MIFSKLNWNAKAYQAKHTIRALGSVFGRYKNLLVIPFIFIVMHSFAQSGIELKGTVVEKADGAPLPLATIALSSKTNQLRAASNNNGKFAFSDLKPGHYDLVTTYLSFQSDTIHFELKKDTAIFIKLKNSNTKLNEVSVKATVPPAVIRNDTIFFNTQYYKTRPNATVEELLKKLPGVQVDQDGNVTVMGKKVDKILINGKTFFIDDLRKATTYLPADIIAQVQVFDSHSEAAQQLGMEENTNTKTINLEIKKEDKSGFVGTAYGGAGNNNSYAAGGNVVGLGDRLFSVDAADNNIANNITGRNDLNNSPIVGKNQFSGLHLNYERDVAKNLTLTAFANRDYNENNQQSSTYRQTFLADSTLLQNQQSASGNRTTDYKIGAELKYKADSLTFISYELDWTSAAMTQGNTDSTLLQTQKNGVAYPSSTGITMNSSQVSNDNLSQKFNLAHRFKKKKSTISIIIAQSDSKQQQEQDLYTHVQTFAPAITNVVNQRSQNPVDNQDYSAATTFSTPLTKNVTIQVTYRARINYIRSEKTSDDYNQATGKYDLPDTLTSNRFINRNTLSDLYVDLTNSHKGKLYYDLGISGQASNQDDNNQSANVETSKTYYSILPDAKLIYRINTTGLLWIASSGNTQAPTISQLQPLPDNTNPYLVKLGNPGLRQAYTQGWNTKYSYFNSESLNSFLFEVGGQYTVNPIGSSTTTLPGGVQQIQYVNLGAIYNFNSLLTYGFALFGQKHGAANIEAGMFYQFNRSLVNSQQDITKSDGISGDLKIDYHAGDNLFIDGTAMLQYNGNRYSLPGETSSREWAQRYTVNASYTFPLFVTAGTKFSFQADHTSSLPGQTNSILNVFIAKDISKDHTLQLRLIGVNLLGAAYDITQSAVQNYIQTQHMDVQGRLVMLSCVCNFKKFNKEHQ